MRSAQARVEEMLDAHFRFDEIEAYIEDQADLTADTKSALWLFAWVETSRQERRRAVGELLAGQAHALS